MSWQKVLSGFCLFLLSIQACFALNLEEKRALFLETENAIERGNISTARNNIDQLGDYALVSYLELSILLQDIDNADTQEIEAFLSKHSGSWIAERLLINWLILLDERENYSGYIRYYNTSRNPSTTATCRYTEALLRTGRSEEAFSLAPKLWLYGKSRPSRCDYLFGQWQQSAAFSEEYIWQRFLLARSSGNSKLASYIGEIAKSAEIKQRIDLYLEIYERPELILEPDTIQTPEPGYSDLVHYGIYRLAKKDPYKAETSLNYYLARLPFSESEKGELYEEIQESYVKHDAPDEALRLANSAGRFVSESHVDWQLKQALAQTDWQRTLDWIALLLPEEAQQDQWLYWKARAQEQLGQPSLELYTNAAKERSYYGFLSAMAINQPYELGHTPITPNDILFDELKRRPGVVRAHELNAVGYYNNSRRAWNYAIQDLTSDQQTIAASVALEMDLYFEAIRSMAAAKYWSDLDIRFPLIFLDSYRHSAQKQSVELSWIYGISRQESSFAPDIRSSSGAMGLMQILPSTAREMARDIDVRFEEKRLIEPDYNIPLGTAYLRNGQQTLQGNMVYATAGYNAGINAARRWLKDGRDQLPLDVWIETIPYRETRGYVKNVLTYSVIFADKLGHKSPMEIHSNLFFKDTRQAAFVKTSD